MKLLILSFAFLFITLGAQAKCTYSFDPANTTVEWTAFKTPDKVGVKGKFTDFKVKKGTADSVLSVMKQGSFSINTRKLDTSDKARDAKIIRSFFGKMTKHGIKGSAVKISPKDDEEGTFDLELTLNSKKAVVPMTYEIDNETLTATGTMNMLAWNLFDSIKGINKACQAKHGKGYTWADVSLKLVTTFKKQCD